MVDHRSATPWDDDRRRPSHAAKRRELLGKEIVAVLRPWTRSEKSRRPPNVCSTWPNDIKDVAERQPITKREGNTCW